MESLSAQFEVSDENAIVTLPGEVHKGSSWARILVHDLQPALRAYPLAESSRLRRVEAGCPADHAEI
jgi:hypothetical protein